MTQAPLLRLADLQVEQGGVSLFDRLFLTLNPGEKATLKGPSGSGKSTLLRCIVGFVPFRGTVEIKGQPLDAHSVWKLRRMMAYVAQEPDLGDGTVQEALVRPFSYCANHALHFEQPAADLLFERFMLPPGLRDKRMSEISGGEKQRVALVGALLLERPLLLLDEAASALDSDAKKAVKDYLCDRADLTVLSVSHDVRDFVLSDRVLDMRELAGGIAS